MNTAVPSPPIPGRLESFTLRESVTTREVNRLLLDTTNATLSEVIRTAAPHSGLQHAFANYDRRRARTYHRKTVPAHYSHGFGHSLRQVATVQWTPSTRTIDLYFPPNWTVEREQNDDWLRAKRMIFDALFKALVHPPRGSILR